MDQRLFILARTPALRDLLPGLPADRLQTFASWATGLFVAGWATGGLLFGLIGDRYGRVRTMTWTIVVYTIFTGLSGLARSWPEFALYRFLWDGHRRRVRGRCGSGGRIHASPRPAIRPGPCPGVFVGGRDHRVELEPRRRASDDHRPDRRLARAVLVRRDSQPARRTDPGPSKGAGSLASRRELAGSRKRSRLERIPASRPKCGWATCAPSSATPF